MDQYHLVSQLEADSLLIHYSGVSSPGRHLSKEGFGPKVIWQDKITLVKKSSDTVAADKYCLTLGRRYLKVK